MDVLVQLIRISDTRHVKSFSGADKSPESGSVGLGDNIRGYTVTTSVPASRDLTSDEAAELHCLGDKNACSFLELDEPLASFTCPDVAFITVFVLVLVGFLIRGLKGLEIVDEFNLLVEDLLLGVIATEKLRF